jgi:pyoverdine/dityrosine biosynthesis protein Dit1
MVKDKNQIFDELLLLINQFRRKNDSNRDWSEEVQELVKNKIGYFYDKKQPVKFLLPGFPFKAGNKRDKVIGELPDDGEILSLNYLDYLMTTLENIYPFGAEFYILLEGFFMNDLVYVTDEATIKYVNRLKTLLPKHIKILESNNLFENPNDYKKIRQEFIEKYCWTIDETKEQLKTHADAQMRFKRNLSFIEEELAVVFENFEDRRERINDVLLDWIRRDIGLTKLIDTHYSEYLRVSRSIQGSKESKIGITLYAGGNGADVPWQRVLLKKLDGTFDFIKRKDGENNPKYKLILTNDGESGYFVEV